VAEVAAATRRRAPRKSQRERILRSTVGGGWRVSEK